MMNSPLFQFRIIATIISTNVSLHSRTRKDYRRVICGDCCRRCLLDDNLIASTFARSIPTLDTAQVVVIVITVRDLR
jgi:hypothetical protein